MSRRPNSEMNGNGNGNGKADLNGKGSHGNGKRSYSWPETGQRRVPRKISLRQPSALLPLTILCIALGLAVAVATQDTRLPTPKVSISQSESFRRAVNRAMSAAELTQTATSRDEWRTVAMWWQESIDLMKMVPVTSPNYSVAQEKVMEYGHNLEYAQNKALSKSSAPSSDSLWSIGSRRSEVLKLQGDPTKTDRYDSMCKEVLHYNNSNVELNNGIVAKYEDLDKNLKVASDDALPSPTASNSYWTLGSTREELFKVQGTPSRVLRYDYSDKELLYYGNSTVDLSDGRVTGYSNHDGNLRVFIPPSSGSDNTDEHWGLDSQREDIFRIQGTPTQVVLDNSVCTEELYYGDSTIQLTNGFITGYDNLDNNLKVKAK